MIRVKEGVFTTIQCEPQVIEPKLNEFPMRSLDFFTWGSLSRGSHFIDYRKWLKYQKSYIFLTSNWRTWRKFCQSWPFKNSNLLVPIRCSKSIIFPYSTAWLLARYQPRFGQGDKSEAKSTSRNKTSSTFQFGIIYHQRKGSKFISTDYVSDFETPHLDVPMCIWYSKSVVRQYIFRMTG